MSRQQIYNQKNNSVVISAIDGAWSRTIVDYGEGDDVIAWEPQAERVTVMEGLDRAALSVSSGTAGKVTIKLKPTSPDCGFLNKLYNQNRTNPQLVNISIVDGVKENIRLNRAVVNIEGSSSGGTTMQIRSFIFIGEEFLVDEDEGSN